MYDHRHLNSHNDAEHLARETRSPALQRGETVVVGNRAGIVEWVSPAWRGLTGFPLADTLGKPIMHFLEVADLESELVDFVAQHFLAGRRCAVEVPFSALNGREIHVHLDVEPIRDDRGDSARFVAVVREIPFPVDDPADSTPAGRLSTPQPIVDLEFAAETREGIDLATVNDLVRARYADFLTPETALDLVLADLVAATHPLGPDAESKIERLLSLLFQAATAPGPPPYPTPRFVSVLTGLLDAGRSHHSLVHAIPARGAAGRRCPGLYIEVHDTAPHLSRDALVRIRAGRAATNTKERAWAGAARLAADVGATAYFDSTPGCGNQALIVIDRVR